MQEINWGIFKAKFNQREQSSFEWLCSLLFCKQFNKKYGIFKYKNQVGVETNPIEVDGEYIAFQAKYYEVRLSERKDEIKETIEKTKNTYPNISKILFYTNQNFGQNKSKNDPKYKTEIEQYALSKQIQIEWNTSGFFESPFVCEECSHIAKYFFSNEKSVIDLLNELNRHSVSILKPVNPEILFNGNSIKIDRSKIIKGLQENLSISPVVILSGEAGAGKTAAIKDLYNLEKHIKSFYVFKATEFNISNINNLFKDYGAFTLSDFIKAHKDEEDNNKLIVIDSAEKLADIELQEVFQEFLSELIDTGWKIIFTIRHSYLDVLQSHILEVYQVNFKLQNIDNISEKELEVFSKNYKFNLPENERLLKLIYNLFYLNEYLQKYNIFESSISYSDFKNVLWDKQISNTSFRHNNTHIKRETCFLNFARERANVGHFYVKPDNFDAEILKQLENSEIIKYDSNSGGYFITHDIYEEWALDRVIERAFNQSESYKAFLEDIGSSLPIRRAFRAWLSEKLFLKNENVIALIKSTISNDNIEQYWKDEIAVSVLLSDYSEKFFQLFEKKLLEDSQKLLLRFIFILRIACKEPDGNLLRYFALSKRSGAVLNTIFTKPNGNGWACLIDFVNKHKEEIGLRHLKIILPALDDWNNKNKQGQTTKIASKIALFYYDEIIKNGGFGYRANSEAKKQIIKIIFNGSFEIQEELMIIFNEVISKKDTGKSSNYYVLIQTALSSFTDSFEIAKNLPEQLISLADLFWFQSDYKPGRRPTQEMSLGHYFGVSEHYSEYYPASAFQTPILQLLLIAQNQTIEFILSFINKTVGCYANSKLKNEAQEIELFFDEKNTTKQYISNRLWNMYRGTQSSPHLLESIHMALEKWLLGVAKKESTETVVSLCKHLIEHSRSASITSVVASVVLSQPSKLFDIAKILFQTKELFFYDNGRRSLDQQGKSLFMAGGLDYHHKFFQDERIGTFNEEHRKRSLEDLARYYQFFRSEEISEQEAEKRQGILWHILDRHYEQLPKKNKENDSDKTWRLYLARIDKRTMVVTAEPKEDNYLIKYTIELAPELKEYSEQSLKRMNDEYQYTPLQLWANYRFEKNKEKYMRYQQYENNNQLVISETKQIINELSSNKEKDHFSSKHSIPSYACSVLIRDFFDELNKEDSEYCKDVILKSAAKSLQNSSSYQIFDGIVPSVRALSDLIKYFPDDKAISKRLLFFILLSTNNELSFLATKAVNHLWETCFDDAHSLFLGYLLLKPKFDNIRIEIRKENRKNEIYEYSEAQVIECFSEKYHNELEKIVDNIIHEHELTKIEELDLEILKISFELLPVKIENKYHKEFLRDVLAVFSKKLFKDDDRINYDVRRRVFEKVAYIILNCSKTDINEYLKPFVDNFSLSNETAEFFEEFINVEDHINKYEEFWIVWETFYPKILGICKEHASNHYTKKIIKNYLLSWSYWRTDAKEWHTLKEREKFFFKKAADDMGDHPCALYSISKILNDIGSNFIDDGINWLSIVTKKQSNHFADDLETDTVFYIENIVRRYSLANRQKIRTNLQTKRQFISILNFLVEMGSVTGYMLRENIL